MVFLKFVLKKHTLNIIIDLFINRKMVLLWIALVDEMVLLWIALVDEMVLLWIALVDVHLSIITRLASKMMS